MTFVIFLVSLLSLASNLYCWNDIKSGRPHIISLRQITLIMDRHVLNRIFGEPQPGYRYPLSPSVLTQFIRARRGYVYREMTADLLCMLAAWRYWTGMAPAALEAWFVLIAGLCQGISLVYSLWLVRKWGHQIHEEISDLGD